MLSFSNVLMGAASSRDGHGHDPLRGRNEPRRARRGLRGRDHRASGPSASSTSTTTARTGALRFIGDGTRRGDGTLTVGSGQSSLGPGNFSDARHDRLQRRLADDDHRHRRFLRSPGHTLRLNGTTTWSAGNVQIQDAGVDRERRPAAGHRHGRGDGLRRAGPEAVPDADRGSDRGLGSLSVGSEIENDGTLRALAGGTLTQGGAVASPADSAGAFDAQGDGRAVAEQRADGRGVERDGHGHDPLRGRDEPRRARRGLRGRDHRRRTAASSTSTTTARPARCAWRRWHAPRRRHADRRQRPILARA